MVTYTFADIVGKIASGTELDPTMPGPRPALDALIEKRCLLDGWKKVPLKAAALKNLTAVFGAAAAIPESAKFLYKVKKLEATHVRGEIKTNTEFINASRDSGNTSSNR